MLLLIDLFKNCLRSITFNYQAEEYPENKLFILEYI